MQHRRRGQAWPKHGRRDPLSRCPAMDKVEYGVCPFHLPQPARDVHSRFREPSGSGCTSCGGSKPPPPWHSSRRYSSTFLSRRLFPSEVVRPRAPPDQGSADGIRARNRLPPRSDGIMSLGPWSRAFRWSRPISWRWPSLSSRPGLSCDLQRPRPKSIFRFCSSFSPRVLFLRRRRCVYIRDWGSTEWWSWSDR